METAPCICLAVLLSCAARAAPVAATAHEGGAKWSVDAAIPARIAAGDSAELTVVVSATDGYKINDKYPYRLSTSVDPPDLAAFDKAELTLARTQARFAAKLTAMKKGDVKLGAIVSLSVCTDKECIVDQAAVDVRVSIR